MTLHVISSRNQKDTLKQYHIYRRLGGASPACPTPRTGKSQFAFAFRFSLSLRSCVRACERSCACAKEMLPLRLVLLEFERSASSAPRFAFFLCFCCVLRGFYKVFACFCCFLLRFCCVLRGFYSSFFAFVFVCAVFYVGFKRFFLGKSLFCCVFVVFYVGFMAFPSFPICFSIALCCVLRGFYGLSFAFVFVCAVFYVGFKRFLPC